MVAVRLLMVLVCAGALAAADFGGRWSGIATSADGTAVPVRLMLSQLGQSVTGSAAVGNEVASVVQATRRDDELRFSATTKSGQSTDFALVFASTGNPLSYPQVRLEGVVTTAGGQSKVILYPVSDNPVGRVVFDARPAPIYSVRPQYTPEARQANVEGTVTVTVEIEDTGMISPDSIHVTRGLGYGLDEAAIECVKQWRFRPALTNGYAAKSAASIGVAFRR